jgi:hypothetical protein
LTAGATWSNWKALRALRLGPAAVDRLQRQGLVEVAPRPDDGLPLLSSVSPARAKCAEADPLAAVKRYAVELAFRMLAGQADETLHVGAPVPNRAALLAWCERCAEDIEHHHGRERAERFRNLIRAALNAGRCGDDRPA